MKPVDIFDLILAIGCLLYVLIFTGIHLYKLFFGKYVTFIKPNGNKLTIPRKYDKDSLNKIHHFINDTI